MNRRDALRVTGATAGTLIGAGCLESEEAERGSRIVGIFPGEDWSRIQPFERWLDRRFAVTTHYVDAVIPESQQQQFVFGDMTEQWDHGRIPIVTWQPFPRDEADENVPREIAAGSYDDVLADWSRHLAEWLSAETDRKFYFRPFPEMNGDWHPWGADASTADDLVDAWRYVYDRLSEEDLTGEQVQWMWNPNATEHGEYETESYYPGEEYVDWIGVDGYNFGDSQPWSTWQSPNDVFEPMLDRMQALSDNPLSFPEFGSSSYRDGQYQPVEKAEWIDGVFDLVERYDVRMVCWFNVDKETDWAVFGGERGTETHADDESGAFNVYREYRDRVVDEQYSVGHDDTHLSTDAFQGAF